jgi:hypothetical protein
LVTKVGKIKPANASSGGRNEENAAIMIMGIAKPTAPFTKPANRVITIAAAKAGADRCAIKRSTIGF